MKMGIVITTNDTETVWTAGGPDLCPVSTMKDLHALVQKSDRVLTF